MGKCVENCMAYTTYVGSPAYFGNYNLYYLFNGNMTSCKHCYFDINTATSPGTYNFQIGLFDNTDNYQFTSISRGSLGTQTGFDTCLQGYCAVWFGSSFTYFTIQALPLSSGGDACHFNTTYCTGNIPGNLDFSHISSSFFNYAECAL